MNGKTLAMNRRTFLRGTGVALALPWFETFSAFGAKQEGVPKRFLSVYHPDGVGLPLKSDPAWEDWSWFPRGGEKDFVLTKVLDVLEPSERHHDLLGSFAPCGASGARAFECGPVFDGCEHWREWAVQEHDFGGSSLCGAHWRSDASCVAGDVNERGYWGAARGADAVV